jgi:phospholipid transport system substrate-binding protein
MKKLTSFILLYFLALNTSYADPQKAGEFVNIIASKVIGIVEQKDLNDHEKEAKLTALFEEVVDIPWISKFVLGRYIQSIDKNDLETYETCYTKFLIRSYIPSFKKYTGQKFKLVSVTKVKDDQYKINTEIIGQHNNPIDISYMLREVNGEYKIFDIIAENVSLIATQRSEFSSVLSNHGIEYLINQLRDRAGL